jgi:hypothetical protein
MPKKLEEMELYAWMGVDELGSGEIGIKQGRVPAGNIPLVSIDRAKVEKIYGQMEDQAKRYGQRIRLVRFMFVEVVRETEHGAE